MQFNKSDQEQIQQLGISEQQVSDQIQIFKDGVSFLQLKKAATPGDGVLVLDAAEEDWLLKLFKEQDTLTRLKFTPASGAASRMFKNLFEAQEQLEGGKTELNDFMDQFFSKLDSFAFYPELKKRLADSGENIGDALQQKKYLPILQTLLGEAGMNYGALPKGLLSFHSYDNGIRTPVEEHLIEGADYARTQDGVARLHFTVSPEHRQAFENLLNHVVPHYEKALKVRYDIAFSEQKKSTDTLAVDAGNEPFRNGDGSMLFRPGGHGALIHNLNELEADIVFIKNIDNVVQQGYIDSTLYYKKVLAGKLLEIRQEVFTLMEELEQGGVSANRLEEISGIIESKFQYQLESAPDYTLVENARTTLMSILDRPIRVCGVVKNQGEAGGGPFWAANSLGDVSLQIVEASQVDTANPQQSKLFKESTHFNPVDLVCSLKNHKGEAFDLLQYVDPATCFISHKSKDGKALKALELPGLWNGAMADWISIFIEVPIETFNPVKTVNDLLRPMHQGK